MLSEYDVWIELAAIAAVVVMFPLYLGFIHVGAAGALAYAAAGGVALALGEHLQLRLRRRPLHRASLKHAAIDAILWVAAISGLGGLVYLFALIFL